MNNTMKAAVIDSYKQPMPEIKDVALPKVRPNDVLVKIFAAASIPLI